MVRNEGSSTNFLSVVTPASALTRREPSMDRDEGRVEARLPANGRTSFITPLVSTKRSPIAHEGKMDSNEPAMDGDKADGISPRNEETANAGLLCQLRQDPFNKQPIQVCARTFRYLYARAISQFLGCGQNTAPIWGDSVLYDQTMDALTQSGTIRPWLSMRPRGGKIARCIQLLRKQKVPNFLPNTRSMSFLTNFVGLSSSRRPRLTTERFQ